MRVKRIASSSQYTLTVCLEQQQVLNVNSGPRIRTRGTHFHPIDFLSGSSPVARCFALLWYGNKNQIEYKSLSSRKAVPSIRRREEASVQPHRCQFLFCFQTESIHNSTFRSPFFQQRGSLRSSSLYLPSSFLHTLTSCLLSTCTRAHVSVCVHCNITPGQHCSSLPY